MAKIKPGAILAGDCISLMDQLEEESVDLVFADPPFNIGYKYDKYHDRRSPEEYQIWMNHWLAAVERVLTPCGAVWVAMGDEFAAETCCLLKNRFHMRNWIIWYYTFATHCKAKFSRSHTHLFYFTKNKKVFTFNAAEIMVPSARQTTYQDPRAASQGRTPDDTWILRPQDIPASFDPDHDCWYIPRVAGTHKARQKFMSTQMPELLLGRIILTCSNEKDLVLDPFLGSGTTAAVAKKLGRQYIGFDLSPNYVTNARKRVMEVKEGDLLTGAPDPLASAPATPTESVPRRRRVK
jgi:site-specific DNA-methyltransferase (adenine-specific)